MVSEHKQAVWPLVLMLVFYGLLIVGSGGMMLLGLAFGSEAYRDRGIPFEELAMIASPFVISLCLLLATVFLWNAQKYLATYILFAACFVVSLIAFFFAFGLVV